ncbi:snRNA-activating protein complex subunit 1 [Musca vetustissima]|uniref:snRNA-activating protein complex subunit 1 n=1 Tax=Musca vetustissima TaxID=27455 RepID=UPI002AB7882C|nr:snRNA-activating protein complex subunit 1 [Musca vetustissima]
MEAALYKDCHDLIEEFINNDSVEFSSFCSVWKKQMFQHIYAVQTSVLEVIQTTKTIFHMAKRSICAKDEFGKYLSSTEGNERRNLLRRIGGMYLMYAIYFKQPTKEYVKITVSLETWRDTVTFMESLSGDPKMDHVRYVFWRLYKAGAFRFTAMDYCVGPELVDYDKITVEQNEAEKHTEVIRVTAKDKLLLVPEIQDDLKEMTAQEDEYNALKKSIGKSKTATLPPTNIFKNMNYVFNNIKNILDGTTEGISETNDNTISKRRRDLKRKAAAIVNSHDDDLTNESASSSSAVEDDGDYEENDELNQFQNPNDTDDEMIGGHDSSVASTSKVLLEDSKLIIKKESK